MNFELFDNFLQVAVLGISALAALFFTIRTRDRRCLILSLAYASFSMGTLFYVLYLVIIGTVPQVFYVAEISWLASYLFYLSLQIFRSEYLHVRFSWPASLGALVIMAAIVLDHIFGPSYFVSGLFALTAGSLVYLSIFRLQSRLPHPDIDTVLIVSTVLQVLLYIVSDYIHDYTQFSLYFATDFLLTASFVLLLPVTLREVLHP